MSALVDKPEPKLVDALQLTALAVDIAGIDAFLVHAKDDTARQWYLNWEFEPSPLGVVSRGCGVVDLK